MERTKIILLLMPLVMSCDRDIAVDPTLQDVDHPLIGSWTYQSVVYQGDTLEKSEPNFEPGEFSAGSFREDLRVDKRHVEYAPNRTYLWFWDLEGQYDLSDGANLQQNPGYWTTRGDSLIHNPEHYSEFGYKIVELTETRFVRQSNRVMTTSFDSTKWVVGDAILFTEIFVAKE